jgi:hypothetical protein
MALWAVGVVINLVGEGALGRAVVLLQPCNFCPRAS